MARLRIVVVAQETDGDVYPLATCKFYAPGTATASGSSTSGTPFAGNLYAAISGGSPISTTQALNSSGTLTVWTDSKSRVDVGIEPAGGGTAFVRQYESAEFDPADVATLTGAETLTNKTLTTPAVTGPITFSGTAGVFESLPTALIDVGIGLNNITDYTQLAASEIKGGGALVAASGRHANSYGTYAPVSTAYPMGAYLGYVTPDIADTSTSGGETSGNHTFALVRTGSGLLPGMAAGTTGPAGDSDTSPLSLNDVVTAAKVFAYQSLARTRPGAKAAEYQALYEQALAEARQLPTWDRARDRMQPPPPAEENA